MPDQPSAPPTPPPGPPIAKFIAPDPDPDAFAPVTIDASASTSPFRFKSYDWDHTGDGKTDLSCDAETPVLTTTTLKSSVRSIGLTVVDERSQTSRFTSAIAVDPLVIPPRVRRAMAATDVPAKLFTGFKTPVGLCSPDTQDAPNPSAPDTTANGGPPAGCLSHVVVTDGADLALAERGKSRAPTETFCFRRPRSSRTRGPALCSITGEST